MHTRVDQDIAQLTQWIEECKTAITQVKSSAENSITEHEDMIVSFTAELAQANEAKALLVENFPVVEDNPDQLELPLEDTTEG